MSVVDVANLGASGIFSRNHKTLGVSLVAQMVKNLPTTWETQVRSLDQEDTLEEAMATHSNVLAWEIPWTEEPGGLQSIGSQRAGHVLGTEHGHEHH